MGRVRSSRSDIAFVDRRTAGWKDALQPLQGVHLA